MKKLKVLYLSSPHFFDMDLSLVNSLKEKCDLYYILDVPPQARSFTAFNINTSKGAGVYPARDFNELNSWSSFLTLNKTFLIYRTSYKSLSFSNLKLQIEIKKIIDRINPDIIHCSSFLNIRFIYFLLRSKRKIILTVHDPFPHSGESSFKTKIKRFISYTFINNIILLNESQKDIYIKSINKRKQIHISSLSVYNHLKDFRKCNVIKSPVFRILFFGRISKYKGLDFLLGSFLDLLSKGYKDIELIIAGSGDFWFDINEFKTMKEIKIINRYISNEELVELIQQASIVVCPYTDATQSGVIMSSFALNKPVIATKVGGLAEMVNHGITGLLINPSDQESLTEAFIKLIENKNLIVEMEKNIEKDFFQGKKSWNIITNKLIDTYHSI